MYLNKYLKYLMCSTSIKLEIFNYIHKKMCISMFPKSKPFISVARPPLKVNRAGICLGPRISFRRPPVCNYIL